MKNNAFFLKDAVHLIRETVSAHKEQNEDSPYFFLVGAGVSSSQIKDSIGLAKDLTSLIKKKAQSCGNHFEKLQSEASGVNAHPTEQYSFWLKSAFGNHAERLQYLKELVRGAKISSANMLLAQILSSRQIAASVVTTNFDDKLFQALQLIGAHDLFAADSISSASASASAVSPHDDQLQIIYAHGTYHFYDVDNINHKNIRPGETHPMTDILDRFYKSKIPIVVGYGGWEDDIVMSRLKEQLRHPLPHCVVWFCYNRQSYRSLPDWLVGNGNVIFVLPENSSECSSDTDCFFAGESMGEEVLAAHDVFSAMISEFEIAAPEIFYDSFNYYMRAAEKLLPKSEDNFCLKRWARRIKVAEQYTISDTECSIKKLENAAVRKNLNEAAKQISALSDMDFLSENDFHYTLFSVVCPLLNEKNSMAGNEDHIVFCESVAACLEKKFHLLAGVEQLYDLLRGMLERIEENCPGHEARVLSLVGKIAILCRKSSDLLALEIKCLHVSFNLTSGADRCKLQEQIVGRCLLNREKTGAACAASGTLCKMYLLSNSPEEKMQLFENLRQLSCIFPEETAIHKRFYTIWLRVAEKSGKSPDRFDACINDMSGRGNPELGFLLAEAYQMKMASTNDKDEQLRLCGIALKYGEQQHEESCGCTLTLMNVLSAMVFILAGRQQIIETKKNCLKLLELQKKIPFCACAKMHAVLALNLLALTAAGKDEKEARYRAVIALCMSDTDKPEFLARLFCAIDDLLKILPEEEGRRLASENKLYQKHARAQAIHAQATNEYLEGNLESAEPLFTDAYTLFKELFGDEYDNPAGIPLAYIKRKRPSSRVKIPLPDLLKETRSNIGNAFRCINLALCHIEGNAVPQSFTAAVAELNKIETDLPSALSWWKNESVVGEEESALVLLLLYFSCKIGFSDIGLPETIFKEKCKKITCLPPNLKQLFPDSQILHNPVGY